MDKDGQLNFDDNTFLLKVNEVFDLIEDGKFSNAVNELDILLNINPNYPGVIEAYRTARFWQNRNDELKKFKEGKETADFLMIQWQEFETYSIEKNLLSSMAYKSAMRNIFFKASHNYRSAFQKQEDTINNFDLLQNLGDCFIRLEEYKHAVETLEYAKTSNHSNATLLSMLAEGYFHLGELTKSLVLFKEAFLINPSKIDITMIKAKPIHDIIKIINSEEKKFTDIREWIPIYGFIHNIFNVRKKISKPQLNTIKNEIYNFEVSYQKLNKEKIETSNILPRMINRYLWSLDYYEFQEFDQGIIHQIRDRLLKIEPDIFYDYFKSKSS